MKLSTALPTALVLVAAGFGFSVAEREGAVLGVVAGAVAAFPLCGVRLKEAIAPASLAAVSAVASLALLGGSLGAVALAVACLGVIQIGATLMVATFARGAASSAGWAIGAFLIAIPFRTSADSGLVPPWAADGNPVTQLIYAAGIDWFRRPALYPVIGTAYSGSLAAGADKTVLWGCLAAGVVAWVASGIVQACRTRHSGSQP